MSMFSQSLLIFWILFIFMHDNGIHALSPCGGDTRGDAMCNHDSTHRVCARIGDTDSTFWEFTGQQSWCGTSYHDDNPVNPNTQIRCPVDEPTWCICKWATEKWINEEGCDNVEVDCDATDVCNLKQSYVDYRVDLNTAKECIQQKCPTHWNAC